MKNIQVIAIKKLRAVYSPSKAIIPGDEKIKVQIQVEAMKLGFVFTDDAINYISTNILDYEDIMMILSELVGADKKWVPFHKNFPDEVYDMPESELYLKAIAHYITNGEWQPNSENKSVPVFEKVEYKVIDIVYKEDIEKLFIDILSSNGSITDFDKEVIEYSIKFWGANYLEKDFNIPFKENLCFLMGLLFNYSIKLKKYPSIRTATDVLRIATYFSDGDISLQKKTKFRLINSARKFLVELLEPVITENDISKYKEEWIHLFHTLHIGTFKKAVNTNIIANLLRNSKVKSNLSIVEESIGNHDKETLLKVLPNNPGDFARRLDKVLRDNNDPIFIEKFFGVIHRVDTRVLIQAYSHFCTRNQTEVRVIIPKGNIQNALLVKNSDNPIDPNLIDLLTEGIHKEITKRFSAKKPLGNVYIDPFLKKALVPFQMRTASDGLYVLQRGSRIKLEEDKSILRFFVHWIGYDIDLSACFLKADLSHHSSITYYNLKSTNGVRAVHSGDITYAPNPDGACEFIDIDLDSITDKNIRYVAMDVRVYSGKSFVNQHANAGWMLRSEIGSKSNKHFDAKTVKQRIKLSGKRQALVALFDIVNREVIWLDLEGQSNQIYTGNNVASNKASITDLAKAAVNLKGFSLYDLLYLHASTRGNIVDDIENADKVFDSEYVFNYTEILSEYV